MNYDRCVPTIGSLCESIVTLQSCGLKSCEVFGSFQSMPSLNTVPQQHLHSPYLIPWHASHFGLSGEVPLIYRVQKISVRIPQEMPEKKPWNGVEIPQELSARGILYLGGLESPFCVQVCVRVRVCEGLTFEVGQMTWPAFHVGASNANNK